MDGTQKTAEALEANLLVHQSLRRQLPNAWNAFFARFGSLRPVQQAAIPPVLAGRNVLVTAPTAGGKTEAVIAPLCERIAGAGWGRTSVVLVTPTRALVNDLFARLERPCEQMRVRVGRKTADHAMSAAGDEQLLVTTPESLESLLTFRRHVLDGVRAVVLDEIHLLDGTPRGDQLRMVLNRLSAYLRHRGGPGFAGLQVIAMSATVPDPRRLADVYLGGAAEIVSVPGQREIDARIVVAGGSDADRAAAAVQAFDQFPDVRKALVFVNSRRQVDAAAGHFRRGSFAHAAVFGHHGSLSKERREEVESRFKRENRAICVATMTLEVGIDIGDIDLVVCLDPPFSLASFLQRIGRGCRRLAGRTRVLCVARDRAGEVIFESLVRQASLGLPPGPEKPFRNSVLVQQVLAYLRQVQGNCRTFDQFVRVFSSPHRPAVPPERVALILEDLVSQNLVDRRGTVYQPAAAGREFIESSRIYTNLDPTPPEVTLLDADSGTVIAQVAAVGGKRVQVAGQTYELLPGGSPDQHKVRAAAGEAPSPRYHPARLPYAADLGAAVAGRLGIMPERLAVIQSGGDLVIMTWLGKLLNAALAAGLSSLGRVVRPGAFSLIIPGGRPAEAMATVASAVEAVAASNPLGKMKVERWADLGPHYAEFSPELQSTSKCDWLDVAYLQGWLAGLRGTQVVEPQDALGADLQSLV